MGLEEMPPSPDQTTDEGPQADSQTKDMDECVCMVRCNQYCQGSTEVDECICTMGCKVYCGRLTSDKQDKLAGIKYCPGTGMELPRYVHRDYKGSSSRRWPVQYQHCAGRAVEVVSIPRLEITTVSLEQDDKDAWGKAVEAVSIPRLEITTVSLEQDDMDVWGKEESWTTDVEEVRRVWKSKEEGREKKCLLPTEKRRGENWGGGGETSDTRRVETGYPTKHTFSNLQNCNQIKNSFGPRRRRNFKTNNKTVISNSSGIRGAVSLATPTANRKRERSVDREVADTCGKKWKV